VSKGVNHLSCYSLILEEGTPFYEMYVEQPGRVDSDGGTERADGPDPANPQNLLPLPSEDEERRMDHECVRFLKAHGLEQYEISNFARPGFESRHNLGYWEGVPYLGLGLGAASLTADEAGQWKRLKNTSSLEKYLLLNEEDLSESAFFEEVIPLTDEDRMSEFCFLGLRKTEGISEETFRETFERSLQEVYGEALRKHEQEGLLEHVDGNWRLTWPRGLDLANQVMVDFV